MAKDSKKYEVKMYVNELEKSLLSTLSKYGKKDLMMRIIHKFISYFGDKIKKHFSFRHYLEFL